MILFLHLAFAPLHCYFTSCPVCQPALQNCGSSHLVFSFEKVHSPPVSDYLLLLICGEPTPFSKKSMRSQRTGHLSAVWSWVGYSPFLRLVSLCKKRGYHCPAGRLGGDSGERLEQNKCSVNNGVISLCPPAKPQSLTSMHRGWSGKVIYTWRS